MLSKEQLFTVLKSVFPKSNSPLKLIDTIYEEGTKRNFSKNDIIMFLAQTGHESAGFTRLEENLNYSAKALHSVFRKYFPTETIAEAYARQPKMIANKVYANRLGNGSTCTNEGYIYRGRGIIQITGKDNYRKLNYETGINCVENPDLLLDMHFAVISAFWFWDYRKLQGKTDIEVVTKLINGGLNGIDDRKNLYLKIKKIVDSF